MKTSYRLLSLARVVAFLGAVLLPICPANAAPVFNVEIDYMVDTSPGGHSHKPSDAEIAAAIQMFACHGFTLNAVVDQAIPHVNVLPLNPVDTNLFDFDNGSTSYLYLKNTYFGHRGQSGWHYCIFGHNYAADTSGTASGSSGLAETPGDDLVVTLGSFSGQIGTPWDRAASFAHEFGHNLGLAHGVNEPFQPNKPSIMSYFYQLGGVRTRLICRGLSTAETSLFKELDYSSGTMCTLFEPLLDERFGTRMAPVDWNCNGVIDSSLVSASIDAAGTWCGASIANLDLLPDVDEWSIIHDPTLFASPEQLVNMPVCKCITAQQAEIMAAAFPCSQPTPASEGCIQARMIYLHFPGNADADGTCSKPYGTPAQVQLIAPAGSHLFLDPGDYHEGRPVTYNKPVTIFANVGAATISP
jgi:hypothetical protein